MPDLKKSKSIVDVLSLGGSIIAPESVDTEFVRAFHALIAGILDAEPERRMILVTGGGGPARAFQRAYREIAAQADEAAQDWIGIMATRLNAELIRSLFLRYNPPPVVHDPTARIRWPGRVLVAAGWKPGFSTDFDAVLLAKRFRARTVVNLSNIAKVHTADPRTNPQAQPVDDIAWRDFLKIVGDTWVPGKNVPFDPVASKEAAALGLRVIMAAGRDLANLKNILHGLPFSGTLIHP
jgi:uridylate kinase